jgi:thymidylate synthase
MRMTNSNTLDIKYLDLVQDIISNGYNSGDRTGTGTRKVFGRMIRHNMSEGFPLLTSKKMFFKGVFHELIWFLKGDTNIKYLVDNNVYIWVGDCYKKYTTVCSANSSEFNEWMRNNGDGTLSMFTRDEFIEKIKTDNIFAAKWGELNKVYGAEWVNWRDQVNQIQELIDTLKNNPDSRRMLVTAWDPINVAKAVLPPCHYAFQVFTRELTLNERIEIKMWDYSQSWEVPDIEWTHEELDKYPYIPKRAISLQYNMRSVDMGLGWPFDEALYGLLLTMIAQCVGMVPDELVCNLGDTHIYQNHIEPIKEQLVAEHFDLPTITLNSDVTNIFQFRFEDITVNNYVSGPAIKLELSN